MSDVRAIAAALLLTLACTGAQATAPADWRTVVTREDRQRLARVRLAWTEALAAATPASEGAITRDTALFAPDRAYARPLPPAGTYRCRTVKLGTQLNGGQTYVAYPFFTCRISAVGSVLAFTKVTGSQRPIGTIYPAEGKRAVFLGTDQLGDETNVIRYGRDRMRDMAGWVERIGAARWRLVLPYPHYESTLDVIEMVPVP